MTPCLAAFRRSQNTVRRVAAIEKARTMESQKL
jgi:hypothetical protein